MNEENADNRTGEQTSADAPRVDAKAERGARPAMQSARAEHRWKTRARLKVLAIALLLFAAVGALVWYLSVRYWTEPVTPIKTRPTAELPLNANSGGATQTTPTPLETQTPAGSVSTTPMSSTTPQQQAEPSPLATPAPNVSDASQTSLLIPVAGVRPEDLQDTYTASRSSGRSHDAIDIIAPRGTPVVAAADGRIMRLFNSVPGGIAIYQLATDDKTILYYAHLERYADGLSEGHFARRGEVIGYVGDTGNAGAGNYHLHFSVSITSDPKHWWGGTNVNPYPLLRGQRLEVRGQ